MELTKRIAVLVLFTLACSAAPFFTGTQTIATSGTAVALSQIPYTCQILTIQAQTSNSGTVYVGGSNVQASQKNGIALIAGASYSLYAPGGPYLATTIFLDSTSSGDKVTYACQ